MKGHKNESPEILRKTILNMADSSKNIQKKNQNALTRTYKKSQTLLCRFLSEYT